MKKKVPDEVDAWRKSSFSAQETDCVEVAWVGALRDSKNPHGPTLAVDLASLLTAAKGGQFDR
jgi:hypothetical protein